MKNNSLQKLALAGILIALGVVASPFSIPFGIARCFPVQHVINVLAAVLLGPVYGVSMAFITSCIRVSMGMGSFLAFPGSMCGALIAALAYKYTNKRIFAYVGEVIGTGIIGGLLAYPIAAFILNNTSAAIFTFVIPFSASTIGGTVIAAVILKSLSRTKTFPNLQ